MQIFNSLSPERQKRCSINIMLDIGPYHEPGAHAWLSIDGKRFGRSSKEPSKISGRMVHIGSSGIYEYWAMVPVTEIK